MIISDYTQMDRIMKEERTYILNIVKTIKKSGCNMLLIQKSILRYITTVSKNLSLYPLSQKLYLSALCYNL